MAKAKKATKITLGQVWQEKATRGKDTRFLRVEGLSRTEVVVSERYSESGRFSAVRSRIQRRSFKRPRYVLWRDAA